jgi:hypothetical protein
MKEVRVFVEGTQRGYAVGTRRGEEVIKEKHFHDGGTSKGIDEAYKSASEFADALEYILKNQSTLLKGEWI